MANEIKKRILRILYFFGITKDMTRTKIDAFVKKHASQDKTLNIGSGEGSYSKYFRNCVCVDIVPYTGVDVVADVHELSKYFQSGEFSTVLCIEALEHFHDPFKAVKEMAYVLKEGGTLILSTRFIFPLHETPHDYFRFTEYGLRHLLKDFEIIECEQNGNTIDTLAVLFQRIGFQCDTLWLKPLKLVWFAAAWFMKACAWILTKEYGSINHKDRVRSIMTSGYCLIARKRTTHGT